MNKIFIACLVLAAACGKKNDKPEDKKGEQKQDDLGPVRKVKEEALNLNKIAKSAKIYFAENSKLPPGKSATLPETPCCKDPSTKCPVTDAWAKDPVWSSIEFQIDAPTLDQYTYTATDDTHAVATAVGDHDCDGTPGTYTLTLTVENGSVTSTITEPTAGTM
jgi:hypothetical protein